MAKITMPFFQATSTALPLTSEVVTVKGNNLPSAGPYYYSRNDVNQLTSVRRNKYYKSGPGRHRPHNLAGLDVFWNQNEATLFNQVDQNQIDEDPVPSADRFRASPTSTASTRAVSGRSRRTARATCR